MKNCLFFLLLTSIVFAAPAKMFNAEVNIGIDNSLPISVLGIGERAQHAVVRIDLGFGITGTGFLVGKCFLLTNHHVLPSASVAQLASFQLNYQQDEFGNLLKVYSYKAKTNGFYYSNQDLDFALVEIKDCPGKYWGFIDLSKVVDLSAGEHISIIGFPRGNPKRISLQENLVVEVLDAIIRYSTDSEPGSSGSILLDNYFRPVALHRGAVTFADGKQLNQGTRLTKLIEHLQEHLTDSKHVLKELGI